MINNNRTNYNSFHNNSNFPTGESVHVEKPVMEEVEEVTAEVFGYVEEVEEVEVSVEEPVLSATALTTTRVWLREEPSTSGKTLRTLDSETKLTILDENTPTWYYVEITDEPGVQGYVMRVYAEKLQPVTL